MTQHELSHCSRGDTSELTTNSQRVRVLYVDDSPMYADLTADMLEREDERLVVETATNAADGLTELSESTVNCVVSDYEMPGQNGIDFFEAVRETHPNLPFILHTGKPIEEIASEATAAGVTDYFQKRSTKNHYSALANRIKSAVEGPYA